MTVHFRSDWHSPNGKTLKQEGLAEQLPLSHVDTFVMLKFFLLLREVAAIQ